VKPANARNKAMTRPPAAKAGDGYVPMGHYRSATFVTAHGSIDLTAEQVKAALGRPSTKHLAPSTSK